MDLIYFCWLPPPGTFRPSSKHHLKASFIAPKIPLARIILSSMKHHPGKSQARPIGNEMPILAKNKTLNANCTFIMGTRNLKAGQEHLGEDVFLKSLPRTYYENGTFWDFKKRKPLFSGAIRRRNIK